MDTKHFLANELHLSQFQPQQARYQTELVIGLILSKCIDKILISIRNSNLQLDVSLHFSASFRWFVECVVFQPLGITRSFPSPCLVSHYFCWWAVPCLLLSDSGIFIFIHDVSSMPICWTKAGKMIPMMIFYILNIHTLLPVTKLSKRTTDQSQAVSILSLGWKFMDS